MHHPSIIRRGRGALLSGLLLCSTLLAASTSLAADRIFRHPKLNFELTHPDGYVVTSEKRGLTLRTEDDQRRLRSRRRDAPNRALEIFMHSNPKALSPADWVRRNQAVANFDNVPGGRYEQTTFANREVVTYSWCEDYCADDIVFASRDGRQ
ncbi:MAG TPA: hypothetical protein VK447_20740, partial [Myxococcaceae bacterium]|nr:hypothetical protein [Myxococcaceae bacterium]